MSYIITDGTNYCHRTKTRAVEIVADASSATVFASEEAAQALLARATKKLKGFQIRQIESAAAVREQPKKAGTTSSRRKYTRKSEEMKAVQASDAGESDQKAQKTQDTPRESQSEESSVHEKNGQQPGSQQAQHQEPRRRGGRRPGSGRKKKVQTVAQEAAAGALQESASDVTSGKNEPSSESVSAETITGKSDVGEAVKHEDHEAVFSSEAASHPQETAEEPSSAQEPVSAEENVSSSEQTGSQQTIHNAHHRRNHRGGRKKKQTVSPEALAQETRTGAEDQPALPEEEATAKNHPAFQEEPALPEPVSKPSGEPEEVKEKIIEGSSSVPAFHFTVSVHSTASPAAAGSGRMETLPEASEKKSERGDASSEAPEKPAKAEVSTETKEESAKTDVSPEASEKHEREDVSLEAQEPSSGRNSRKPYSRRRYGSSEESSVKAKQSSQSSLKEPEKTPVPFFTVTTTNVADNARPKSSPAVQENASVSGPEKDAASPAADVRNQEQRTAERDISRQAFPKQAPRRQKTAGSAPDQAVSSEPETDSAAEAADGSSEKESAGKYNRRTRSRGRGRYSRMQDTEHPAVSSDKTTDETVKADEERASHIPSSAREISYEPAAASSKPQKASESESFQEKRDQVRRRNNASAFERNRGRGRGRRSAPSSGTSTDSKRRIFTQQERNLIYNRTEGHCGICGRFIPLEEYTIDHIIPLSKGGTNDLDNLQACCSFCNKAKDDSMGDEFYKRIQRIFLYQTKLRYGKKQLKKLRKTLREIEGEIEE